MASLYASEPGIGSLSYTAFRCRLVLLQVFVPFMVFGCIASLGGLLTLFMPETLGAAMPEQVEVSSIQLPLHCPKMP